MRGDGRLPGLGGGVSEDAIIRASDLERHTIDGRPVAFARRAKWQGRRAADIQEDIAARLTGGVVSETTRKAYLGLFRKWTARRSALGKSPFVADDPEATESNESEAIAYVVLNLGPLGRDVGDVQNHLKAIGYRRKIRCGDNLLRTITRLQYLTNGGQARKRAGRTKTTFDDGRP